MIPRTMLTDKEQQKQIEQLKGNPKAAGHFARRRNSDASQPLNQKAREIALRLFEFRFWIRNSQTRSAH
jgi:hypothetical protein